PNKALLPADGSVRHDKLQVYEGFACLNCPFRTISIQLMRRHQSSPPEGCSSGVSHTRSRRRRDLDQQFECVYLQTWTTGSTRKYWIIKRGGSIVRQVDNPAVQAHLRGVLTREFSRQQPNPDTMTTTAPAPSAGTTAFALQTPWLDRTGWDRTYSNKGQREVLAALTRTCTSPGGQEYFVGSGKVYGLEDDIVSPGEDEDRIACLVRLVDVVMSRCEETARKTSRHILCWLRSNQASSIYGKPFTLVQSSSTSKYWLLLKRCLAMVCRIYRLHPDRRIKVAGLALSRKQLQFLDAIWTHEALGDLAALNELIGSHTARIQTRRRRRRRRAKKRKRKERRRRGEEEEGEDSDHDHDQEGEEGSDKQENDSGFTAWLEDLGEITEEEDDYVQEEADAARGSPEELVELLFGLTLAIATQPVINGQPQTTVLIYFSGILGFSSSPGGGAFLPARPYTSNLSGLVYILRLVLLEYALPLRAYPTLALQRRPRMGQLKRLQPVRRQYMVMESQSPMEELLSLRNYGQVISRSDTPAYLLRWSANGQAVSFGDKISISMGQFRRLPEHFIKEAARLCNEMMFSWDPVINLSNITDDMTNNKEGFSFVLHPKNKLDTAYLELLHRTSRAHRNSLVHGGNWDWNAIFQYFKRDEALLSAILGGMFCTGGQLPRCTEVLSLLCCNGELQPRGIYVYDRSMIYITRHHKAKKATNREFIVARFLPAQLGHILYKYLVYIRPFINMLHRERWSGTSSEAAESPLLFRERAALSSRSWQTGRLTSILKGTTSLVWGEPVNSRQFRQICIGITEKHVREQNGHHPLQRAATYGLDGAFPTKLQPQLLELYRWASTRWHEFLHLPSFSVHTPTADNPFHWNFQSSAHAAGSSGGDVDRGYRASTPIEVVSSPPSTSPGRIFRQGIQQQQLQSTSQDLSGIQPKESEMPTGSFLNGAEFLEQLHREDEEIFEAELQRQRQEEHARDRPNYSTNNSTKRTGHQVQGSKDTAPSSKRRRLLLTSSAEAASLDHQLYDDDSWSYRPLFGIPSEITTNNAMQQHIAILDRLNSRAGFSDDKNLLRAKCKLWELGRTLEHWTQIGCQLCYVRGDMGLDHQLDDCTAAGSKVAQRLCGWLEARDLDRYIEARGRCSLCTETDQICRDIALSLWVQSASTEEEKNRWKQEYVSVTNPDGHCGNKPAIRRAIAALCAFDGQIFDSQAAEWFEQKVPHGETWVPQLLVVFDMLVTAFDLYVPGPRQSDRPAGQNNTDSSNHAKGQPYLRIISRNALRFLFLTNHRLAFSPHIFPDKYALRFSYRTNVGKSGDPPSLQDSDC
ncbi:hypothetical protein FOXB_16094, partial [Fusarium oxysporum f. sp. conglutinans Fo5176]